MNTLEISPKGLFLVTEIHSSFNKIYLGGGGGAGQMNDALLPGGGNGGGIAIIMTNFLISNSYKIRADGESPIHIAGPADDGRSGGGAGGTILVNYGSLLDSANLSATGGNGDFCIAIPDWYHGPGGGGGGGIVWTNKPANDPLLKTTVSGGRPGTNVNIVNNTWGATQGESGSTLFNLSIPADTIPFVKGVISSFISIAICNGQNYAGYITSGIYNDTLISMYGCDSVRTIQLVVNPNSSSTITQSICQGQTYLGYGSSGTYIDTLAATNGCDSVRTLHLAVYPTYNAVIDTTICYGQSFEGHNSSSTYNNKFTTINGCDSIRTIHLTVSPQINPALGIDTAICAGNSITLYPGQFTSYLWQDGSTQSRLTINQPGLYSVIITNNCGIAKDEIVITGGFCDVYFPSAFTPNNDGKNDLFKIPNVYQLSNYHLVVYSRWGQKVFETTNPSRGWNGQVNGKLQNTGAFAWYCEFRKPGSADLVKMNGTVMLVR